MAKDLITTISEWRPVSELKQVGENISAFGYVKEYIDEHRLQDKKQRHCSNEITGLVDFFEPLEVKRNGNVIFYRENNNHIRMDKPEVFETQYGIFNNHNNGEFTSWLDKSDYSRLPKKDKAIHRIFERGDFWLEGNFCDMFDCGKFTYAISNLMHMGLGNFKIVRLDQELNSVVIYDNSFKIWSCLQYEVRYKMDNSYIIIASGFTESDRGRHEKRKLQNRTLMFQVDEGGNCDIIREWKIKISSSNSLAVLGDYAYFGQNKMITRLNFTSGELAYYTNKSDEELAALRAMW